jgi:drug/metabolite transporter (DMT)-like permease
MDPESTSRAGHSSTTPGAQGPAVPAASALTRPSARKPQEAALALAAAALAAALFIGMDASVKMLAHRLDALQLTFLRFASGSMFALPLWLWFRTPLPARASRRLHVLRSVLLLLALLLWFHSLTLLPLVQAVAMAYTAPLFISLLAMLLLKERPSRWIWVALALGGAGAAVALWPEWQASQTSGGATRLVGLATAAVSTVCYAGVVILARHQAQRDSIWTILLVQNLLPLVLLAAPAAWRWQPMPASDMPLVLLIGALATGGLLCITWAFSHIEASRAAPMEYTGLVWAAVLGYGLFGEIPTVWTLVSAGLIILGCLLLMRR